MARVVQQQRSNPPYLLIIFAMLFVMAAAAAVLQTVGRTKDQQEFAAKDAKNVKIYDASDLNRATVKKAVEKATPRLTVLAQQDERIKALTKIIAGSEDEADPEAVADQAFKALGDRSGLAYAIIKAYGEQKSGVPQIVQDKEKQIADLKKEIAAQLETIRLKDQQILEDANASNVRVAELDRKLKDNQQESEKAQAAAAEDKARSVKELNAEIANATKTILRLEKELADARPSGPDGIDKPQAPLVIKPDGKIMKMAEEEGMCYIDLGAKQHLKPGLTFTVYPASGIPPASADPNMDKSKGRIEVVTVHDNFSLARMIKRDKNNPIVVDDLIANIAFDKIRAKKFVVVGLFDLYNRGKATAEDAPEVASIIKRFGGTISKEVTPDTDYIVVGEEPPIPPPAAADEPAATQAARAEKARLNKEYVEVVRAAKAMQLPVLNVNRFIAMTGYDPAATEGR